MILTKTNTDIFGKTVPDDTPVEHLGGRLYLIRGRVFFKSGDGNAYAIAAYLDGQRTDIGVHYDLVSKSYVKWEIKVGRTPKDAGAKALALITYDTRKIAVEDL